MTTILPAAPPPALGGGAAGGGRNRRRVIVVTVLSVLVALTASGPYLLLDPAVGESTVGLRKGVSFHFPFLVVHAMSAGIALLTGPWQFVRRIRRHPRVHRCLGRIYLLAVVPASLSGIVLAVLTTAGPLAGLGFALLDIAWVVTAAAGYLAAREHRWADHRTWMTRNFALTFAGVMLRVWVVVLMAAQLSHDQAYALVPWLSWLPNLGIVEWTLRRRRRPSGRRSPRSDQVAVDPPAPPPAPMSGRGSMFWLRWKMFSGS